MEHLRGANRNNLNVRRMTIPVTLTILSRTDDDECLRRSQEVNRMAQNGSTIAILRHEAVEG